jgi:hypothetical protein
MLAGFLSWSRTEYDLPSLLRFVSTFFQQANLADPNWTIIAQQIGNLLITFVRDCKSIITGCFSAEATGPIIDLYRVSH